MLVRIIKNATTVNLNQMACVRAVGTIVEAVSAVCSVQIAECTSEKDARALEQAIFDAWIFEQTYFEVDKWCTKNNISFK